MKIIRILVHQFHYGRGRGKKEMLELIEPITVEGNSQGGFIYQQRRGERN